MGTGYLAKLGFSNEMLQEVVSIQDMISTLLACGVRLSFLQLDRTNACPQVLLSEPQDEISLVAFRLLVKDLLDLFSLINECMIVILRK